MTLEMRPAGPQGLILSRDFDAGPEALFDAHVTPERIRAWMFGPEGWKMTDCKADPRPGGRFRFVYAHDEERPGFTIEGVYDAVERPTRLRHRETMTTEGGAVETHVETRFEPQESGGTRLRVALGYPTASLRDAILSDAMQAGMEAGYARLERLVSA